MVQSGMGKVFHHPLKPLGVEYTKTIKYALELENHALKITLLETAFEFHTKTALRNSPPFR